MGDAGEDRAKAAELPEGDVVRILLEQHTQIRAPFVGMKRANGPDKKDRFDDLEALLALHETAQEVVDARNREEADADAALADLEGTDLDDPELDIRLEAFRTSVLAHAEAEEKHELGVEGRARGGRRAAR